MVGNVGLRHRIKNRVKEEDLKVNFLELVLNPWDCQEIVQGEEILETPLHRGLLAGEKLLKCSCRCTHGTWVGRTMGLILLTNPIWLYPHKKGTFGHRHTHREKADDLHVKEMMKTDLHSKEHQRLPAIHQKLGEKHRTDFPSHPSEGTNPSDTLVWVLWPPK